MVIYLFSLYALSGYCHYVSVLNVLSRCLINKKEPSQGDGMALFGKL